MKKISGVDIVGDCFDQKIIEEIKNKDTNAGRLSNV